MLHTRIITSIHFQVYDSRDEIHGDSALTASLPSKSSSPSSSSSLSGGEGRHIDQNPLIRTPNDVGTVCVARNEYYGLVGALFALLLAVIVVTGIAGVCYRKASVGKMAASAAGTMAGHSTIASVIASGVTFGPKRTTSEEGDMLQHQRRRRSSVAVGGNCFYNNNPRYPRAESSQRFSYHQPDLNLP
jgi:hypothetical protein